MTNGITITTFSGMMRNFTPTRGNGTRFVMRKRGKATLLMNVTSRLVQFEIWNEAVRSQMVVRNRVRGVNVIFRRIEMRLFGGRVALYSRHGPILGRLCAIYVRDTTVTLVVMVRKFIQMRSLPYIRRSLMYGTGVFRGTASQGPSNIGRFPFTWFVPYVAYMNVLHGGLPSNVDALGRHGISKEGQDESLQHIDVSRFPVSNEGVDIMLVRRVVGNLSRVFYGMVVTIGGKSMHAKYHVRSRVPNVK